jgi:NTE family protein
MIMADTDVEGVKPQKLLHKGSRSDHAYAQTVLVLQGGGALGAYQGGAYEVLHDHGVKPDWVAGISIGAINASIIVGNAPQLRAERLRSFWSEITRLYPVDRFAALHPFYDLNFRRLSGLTSIIYGVDGFYKPWPVPPWFAMPGSPEALSFYDTSALHKTLVRYVDFGRINNGDVRLSLGAVNVKSGNFTYFDTHKSHTNFDGDEEGQKTIIGPEHIMASGALPPSFAPVIIKGKPYWDGGVVSNTPLSYVLDGGTTKDTLVFQIDLFSSAGPLPTSLDEVQERVKDITYSSRTRMNTDMFMTQYRLRRTIRKLYELVAPDQRPPLHHRDMDIHDRDGRVCIVHLINRGNRFEIQSKDYEFSRVAMEEHWAHGQGDASFAMAQTSWKTLPDEDTGLMIYDYTCPEGIKVEASE